MKALAVLALALGAPPVLAALPALAPGPAVIRVTGHAEVSRAPDRVYLDLTVVTRSRQAAAAVDENARRTTAVLAALKKTVGPRGELTTTQYSLAPEYRYVSGAPPEITGYTASEGVRVRLDDLARLGSAIKAASGAGANRFEGIRFALRDPGEARAEALREAALEARRDAATLAAALGLRIVRVRSVSDTASAGSPPPGPRPIFEQVQKLAVARVSPPIESGSLGVSAAVSLTVEVAPAPR